MLPYILCAQVHSEYSWEQFVDDYLQYVASIEEESDNYVERHNWLEELEEYHNSPININAAERSELQALHFLSDEQVDSLISRRDRYRDGFRSVGELMTVRSLSYRDRAWLSQLICFGQKISQQKDSVIHIETTRHLTVSDNRNKWYGGNHDFSATIDKPLNQKAGFYKFDGDNYITKMFTGQPFSHTIKYRYSWLRRVMYGATFQEDIGERFGAYGSRPYDYQSAYFYYKSNPEKYKRYQFNRYNFVVGDYNISIGQGLLISRDGWGNYARLLTGVKSETTMLHPHTGMDESNFLRGAAGTIKFGKRGNWCLTAFLSSRKHDATILGMSKANEYSPNVSDTITAWKTDGYHRTFQEINKRNVITRILLGGRFGYQNDWLNFGVSAMTSHTDKTYWPASRAYNQYYMRGKNYTGLSIDYTLKRKSWSLQGEAAISSNDSYRRYLGVKPLQLTASTLALRWRPLSSLSLVLAERSFAKAYVSPFGNTLQANSLIQNEHGVVLGTRFSGIRRLEITCYGDFAYHPHPAYLADKASHRLEAMAQLSYRASRRWNHSLSYKIKGREQNVRDYKKIPDLEDVLLSWRTTQHLRFQTTWNGDTWSFTTGADGALFYSQGSAYNTKLNIINHSQSLGGLIFARSSGKLGNRSQLKTMIAGFATDDYNSRCYAYVPQLLSAAHFPTFSGKGCFGAIQYEMRLWRQLFVSANFSTIKYFDRSTIGTDLNMIEGSWKNDLSLQLKCRL